MTGCDHNSGFYGHGKKVGMVKVIKNQEARNLLSSCGLEVLPLQPNVLVALKKLVLKYMGPMKYCVQMQGHHSGR